MMLTQNSDVANGEANGSRVRVEAVKLSVYASQVDSICLEHENEDITPSQFELKSKTFNFQCRMNVKDAEFYTGMRGEQFPIISNSCTTGHKLQGCTVDSILANDWYYGANWPYAFFSTPPQTHFTFH